MLYSAGLNLSDIVNRPFQLASNLDVCVGKYFKDAWEEPSTCQNSVLSYLVETRENMRYMSDMAQVNETKVKQK
jgi:hypothetical protein